MKTITFKGQPNPEWLLINKTPLQTSPGIAPRYRSVSGRPGAYPQGVDIGSRALPFEVTILADNQEDLQDKAGQLAGWLFSEKEEKLTVSDQPGIYYMAMWGDDGTFSRIANLGEGPLVFTAGSKPMKQSEATKSATGAVTVTISNAGTYKTGFKIEMTFATGGTNYTIQNAAGEFIKINRTFAAGDKLEIRSMYDGENAAILNGQYIMPSVHLQSTFFKLPPGQNSLTVNKGGTGDTKVTIREERF